MPNFLQGQNFLADYLKYNEGNECPKSYHIWSAFCVLSSVISRRVYIDQGYFRVHANLYVCLVGKQGNRKTTAKDIAYDLLRDTHPEIPVSGESMSKEAITKFMAADEQLLVFTDEKGMPVEYRPLSIFATELKYFFSINPVAMTDFLTAIYDRKKLDVITKNQGTDTIINPYVVFLACETPEWLVARLKDSVLSGGFLRRLILVNETELGIRIPFPEVTAEASAAWARVKTHLKGLTRFSGPFTWTPEAREWFSKWYVNLKIPADPILAAFYGSINDQLLKICMLITLCDYDCKKLVLTVDVLQVGLQILHNLEKTIPRLSEGIGKSELSSSVMQVLDVLDSVGGEIAEGKLHGLVFNNLPRPNDFEEVLKQLERQDKIRRANLTRGGVTKKMVLTLARSQQIAEKQQEKKV